MMIQLLRVLVQRVMRETGMCGAPHHKVSTGRDTATSENSISDNEEKEQHVKYFPSSPS
jgi:hypothetical protein